MKKEKLEIIFIRMHRKIFQKKITEIVMLCRKRISFVLFFYAECTEQVDELECTVGIIPEEASFFFFRE